MFDDRELGQLRSQRDAGEPRNVRIRLIGQPRPQMLEAFPALRRYDAELGTRTAAICSAPDYAADLPRQRPLNFSNTASNPCGVTRITTTTAMP